MSFPILTTLYGLPLAAVIVIFAIPGRNERAIKVVSLCFSVVSLLLSLWVYITYDRSAGGLQLVERVAWLPSLGVNYYLAVDGIKITLLLLTGVIITAGVLASWGLAHRTKEFFILLLLLTGGVFGVFMAHNLFLFFLFYELAVLPMYLLIGIWGTGKKEYAAMKLTLYLMAGSALIVAGILAIGFASGTGSLDLDVLAGATFDPTFQKIFFPILFVGFGILAALWPFHTWSPDGHASAPTAVSMLHAGVLMKLGAYGCLLVPMALLPEGARFWLPAVAALAIVNIVYGSIGAVAQKDLKYVVAYSSVSHMGIVLLGLASMNQIAISGAVLQMFSHGIMTGLFFALVGMVYGRTHTRMVDEQGGLAARMPLLAVFFVFTGLTSLGLPGLSGFPAELAVFIGAFRRYPALAVLAMTSIVVTAFYVLRVVQRLFFGPPHLAHETAFTDARPVEVTALAMLALVVLTVGIYPFPFLNTIGSAVASIAARLGGM
jgi:NADH-quinone oxidoreductase subunit M